VTAAAALLRGRDVSLSPASIAALLETSARDLGDPGHDTTFGWGLLQAQDLCPNLPVSNLPTQLTTQALDLPPNTLSR
jgi:hypothetical protein